MSFDGTDFVVTPSVEDVELVELEVLLFEPDVLPGGKELMGGVVKGLFKANKADVTKQIAAALGPVKLPRLAAVTGPAAAGENPVLRRYAASVILSELVQHGTPGTGLSVEQTDAAFVAPVTAWLEQPTKWTRVAVTRLAVRDGVVYVGGRITGPFSGMARFELPAVSIESAFGGVLSGEIEGDVQFKGGKPGGGNVYVSSASVSDFQAAALPVRLAAAGAQNMLNRVAAVKAAEFRPKIEAALGGPRPRAVGDGGVPGGARPCARRRRGRRAGGHLAARFAGTAARIAGVAREGGQGQAAGGRGGGGVSSDAAARAEGR